MGTDGREGLNWTLRGCPFHSYLFRRFKPFHWRRFLGSGAAADLVAAREPLVEIGVAGALVGEGVGVRRRRHPTAGHAAGDWVAVAELREALARFPRGGQVHHDLAHPLARGAHADPRGLPLPTRQGAGDALGPLDDHGGVALRAVVAPELIPAEGLEVLGGAPAVGVGMDELAVR